MRTKEQKAAYQAAYYKKNKARLNASTKAWYEANREKAAASSKQSYARIHSEPFIRAQYLVRSCRARAKRKGFECSITAHDIARQIELGVCAVTGIRFHLETNAGRHHFTPSIDRIDNTRGYVPGNVRVVIWAFNAMRGDWGDDILLQITTALKQSSQRAQPSSYPGSTSSAGSEPRNPCLGSFRKQDGEQPRSFRLDGARQ